MCENISTNNRRHQVSIEPKVFPNKKYVFCYFLGDISNEYKDFINELSKKYNLEILNVSDTNSEYYNYGPSEFIYSISHAEMICTDSFHATVFSIMYEKEFIIFARNGKYNKMGGRIKNLLKTFNISGRYYSDINLHNIEKIDYSNNEIILKKERKKIDDFLKCIER